MRLQTILALGLSCFGLLGNGAVHAADSYPGPASWQPDLAQREHLRRSLTLLSLSTPTNRKTVRVGAPLAAEDSSRKTPIVVEVNKTE
jgi:hypothetical protein